MRAQTWLYKVALPVTLLVSSLSFAQGNAVITGTVTDAATGKPVPDVVVTGRSPALQGEEMVVTDATGTYRMGQLPAGTYELTLEKESYKPFKRGEITIRSDRTVRVNIQLQPEALKAEEIVVVGKPPTVDVGNTTTGATVGKEFINNIAFIQPNGSGVRSFESLAAVAPQTSGDDFGYGFSGAQSPENLYLVDGVSVSDPAFGTNGAQFPVEFVEEANVITGGYNAEYGRATGGILSVTTKSGSNEFHGSVWTDWSPGALVGDPHKVYSDSTVFVGKSKTDSIFDFGAEVGGPILKDKLWFYVGFSPSFVRIYDERSLRRFITNASATDFVYCSTNDVKSGKCTQEQYNQGMIRTEALPGTTRSRFDSVHAYSYIAKLTYLINSDNNVSASVVGSNASSSVPYSFNVLSPNMTDAAGNRINVARAGTNSGNDTRTISLKYQGAFMDKHLLVDASFGWFNTQSSVLPNDGSKLDYTLGKGASGLPLVSFRRTRPYSIEDFEVLPTAAAGLCDGPTENAAGTIKPSPAQVNVRGSIRYVMACPATGAGATYNIGGAGGMSSVQMDRYQFRGAVTYLMRAAGHHQFKAGLDIENERYDITKAYSGGDVMYQTGSGSYFYDYRQYGYLTGPDEGVQQKFLHSVPTSMGVGAYLQDRWDILDLVTLNAGIRYENQQLIAGDGSLGMTVNNMIAPRIGLIYDFTQQGRSKFYANFARYYESVPMDMADRALTGENEFQFYRRRTATTTRKGCNPLKDISQSLDQCLDPHNYLQLNGGYAPSLFGLVTGGGKTPVDPNINAQSTDEIVLGGEYEVITDGRVGVTYTHRYMNYVIEDMSIDEATTYFLGNPGYGLATSFPKATRDYDAVTLQFTKAFSDGWQGQVSYTISSLRGNYNGLYRPETGQIDPNINSDFDLVSLLPNHTGPLAADRTHHIKAYGSKEFVITGGLSLTLGLTYEGQSGTPLNYYGAHAVYGADEVFILPRGSGGRLPWIHHVNLKGGVNYKLSKDNVVSFTTDIFNVLNLQDVTSVDETFTSANVLPYITPAGQNAQASACLSGTRTNACSTVDPDGNLTLPIMVPDTDADGNPIKRRLMSSEINPNFKRPTSYQSPISVRFGLKVTF